MSHRCISRELRNPTTGEPQHREKFASHERAHDGVLCPRTRWRRTTQRRRRISFRANCTQRRFRLVALPARNPVQNRGDGRGICDRRLRYCFDRTSTIDLYKPSRLEMKRWGVRYVDVDILYWGSDEQSIKVLT